MYCDACGSKLSAQSQYCSNCGKAVAPGLGLNAPAAQGSARQAYYAPGRTPVGDGRVRRNLDLVALMWFVSGILRVFAVFWILIVGSVFMPSLFVFLRGLGSPLPWGLGGLVSASIFSVGIFLGFFGFVHLLVAWGLYHRENWARAVALIIGFLALIRVPIGTIMGAYTLWVLLPEHCASEYDEMSREMHGQLSRA